MEDYIYMSIQSNMKILIKTIWNNILKSLIRKSKS